MKNPAISVLWDFFGIFSQIFLKKSNVELEYLHFVVPAKAATVESVETHGLYDPTAPADFVEVDVQRAPPAPRRPRQLLRLLQGFQFF